MTRIWHSVAFDLALSSAGLVVGSTVLLSTVFYFGTIGVLTHDADAKIESFSERLSAEAECTSPQEFARHIAHILSDGVDSDTEVYLFSDGMSGIQAGNIAPLNLSKTTLERVIDKEVVRDGLATSARVRIHRLSDGAVLIVGRDQRDLLNIGNLVATAIASGGILTLGFAGFGATLFHRQLEARISDIRQAAREIEAGDLTRRIPLSEKSDEFTRLSADINHMLDRIELLMEGVRHVSNTIAHNLRTPLARIRGHLEDIQRSRGGAGEEETPENFAIEEIEQLSQALNKLLQIAEAESGTRRQPFGPVDLRVLVRDLADLYEAAAEDEGLRLRYEFSGNPVVHGDRDLLAAMVSNLLDNALKYAGPGATILIKASPGPDGVVLSVEDNGPGIPRSERSKVLSRFYRLDHKQQGNGLGLSIVAAFTALHEGTLRLEDAGPGLRVRMVLPGAGGRLSSA